MECVVVVVASCGRRAKRCRYRRRRIFAAEHLLRQRPEAPNRGGEKAAARPIFAGKEFSNDAVVVVVVVVVFAVVVVVVLVFDCF